MRISILVLAMLFCGSLTQAAIVYEEVDGKLQATETTTKVKVKQYTRKRVKRLKQDAIERKQTSISIKDQIVAEENANIDLYNEMLAEMDLLGL